MAALSADVSPMPAHRGNVTVMELESAVTDVFYKGGICYFHASGGVTPVADTALYPAGIILEQVSATANVTRVKVARGGQWLIQYNGTPALTDEGLLLYVDISAQSDNPDDLLLDANAGTGDIPFGLIVEYVSATAGAWVDLNMTAKPVTHA